MRSIRKAVSAAVVGLATIQVWAQTSLPPLQTCTPAQARASERYWFAGGKLAMDFGVSGTAQPSITANPGNVAAVAEGSTVITDANGTLQFWVGQGSIYNRNQTVMTNGSSITGNLSAVQVVVAFAAPDVPGKYFVVSTSGIAAGTAGQLRYTVVDMNTPDGLGEVTSTKNVVIPNVSSNETISAVPNHDGTGYWVLTTSYATSNLVAQLFDSNGPKGLPVVTTLSKPIGNNYGSIYFNKDLTQFVVATGSNTGPNNSFIRTLTLDAQTGKATEIASWTAGANGTIYAADFSPSGKYLYVSHIYEGHLYRYDVSSGDAVAIKASEQYFGTTGSGRNGGGHIRRGADGAMWIANNAQTTTLSRIPNPDAPVMADTGFVRGNITLPSGATSRWGLPQTVAGCAKALAPDAVPAISGPAPFYPNTPQTLAVSVTNEGAKGDVADGKLVITLPANVQAGPGLPAACTVVSPQIVECNMAAVGMGPVAPAGTLGPINIPVTVSVPGTYTVGVEVQNVTGEIGAALTNNTALTSITALALTPPDAVPSFTAAPTAPFPVGSTQQLQLQVVNAGTMSPISDGRLTVSLPPNLRQSGALSTACTMAAAAPTDPQVIQCDLLGDWTKAIAPGGSAQGPLTLSVIASAPGSYNVDVEVSGVTSEVNLANNKVSVTLVAQQGQPPITGGGNPTPVPALGGSALAALSAAFGALVFALRRRKGIAVDH